MKIQDTRRYKFNVSKWQLLHAKKQTYAETQLNFIIALGGDDGQTVVFEHDWLLPGLEVK